MDKLKSVLHRDKPEAQEDTQSPSSAGRISGQGSHFPKADSPSTGTTAGFSEQPNIGTSPVPGTGLNQTSEAPATTGASGDDIGTASIGQTSTYSSHALRKGDAVGSVIDRTSEDPTTYKMPEHTHGEGTSSSGVPAGAAGTAASLAFHKHQNPSTSNIPGAFPKESAHDTVTLPPINRPIDYEAGRATDQPEGNVSSAIPGQSSSTAPTSSGVSSEVPARTETQKSGALGKMLAAVGLGGAGVAASKAEDDRTQAVADTPDQPTTTTGTDSYTAPTQSGPPPSHHRKESIPTTAYPAGPSSPSPIQAPVGGTRGAVDEPQSSTHTGRDAGLAAAGLAAGAGALGAHEYGKDRSTTDAVPGGEALRSSTQGTTSAPTPGGAEATSYTISGPTESQERSQTGRDAGLATGQPSTQTSQQPYATEPEEQSGGYGKTAAVAGLGAGAGAAGIAALQHEKKPESSEQFADKSLQSSTASAQPSTAAETSLPVRESAAATQSSRAEPTTSARTTTTTDPARDDSHTGRNAALTGAAGAGLGAYGVHEYDQRRAAQEPSQQAYTGTDPNTSTRDATYQSPSAAAPVTEKSTHADPTISSRDPAAIDPRKDESHTGRNAALAGTAAAAGAGAYGAHEYNQRQTAQEPTSQRQLAEEPTRERYTETQPATSAKDTAASKPSAAAAAPITDETTRQETQTEPTKDESHTGRNAALAGAAGAGAGAYGAHEYSKHEAEKDAAQAEARRQKDIAEQEAARQKQFEKDQKAAEKQAHKEEKQHEKDLKKQEKAEEKAHKKEEKEHQKELKKQEKAQAAAAAKEEKEHQKELEKHDKAQAAVAAKEERQHQKELDKEEEEERKRREKEAAALAAGTAGTGAAAAGYAAHEKDSRTSTERDQDHERNRLHKDPPEEKKPNIFKRIFKRRKNKDTGDSEDYSTDEEEITDPDHRDDHLAGTTAVGGAGAATAAGTAGAIAGTTHEGTEPTTTATAGDKSYEAQSGGVQKPSYNPFHHDEPTTSTTTAVPGTTGTGTAGTQDYSSPTTRDITAETTSPSHGISGTDTTTATGPHDPASTTDTGAEEQHQSLGRRILEQLKPLPTQQELRHQHGVDEQGQGQIDGQGQSHGQL